jgi:hypothetical protein
VGKHSIPFKWPANPVLIELPFSEIVGVHPAVLGMIAGVPLEPFIGLRAVNDAPIDDIFGFPRIAVVPVRGESGYWCWIGIKAYRRLVDCAWRGKVTVLDYGPRISEEKIARLGYLDWVYASAITGSVQTADWVIARRWEEETDYVCRPVKAKNARPSGLRTFAKLRGLNPRRLSDDKASEAKESSDSPETTTDDSYDEGSKG